ncbi:MAG: DUF4869 domain-containing protein [Lachnospiraceae bacterium]|nr:DUF4869 domain-containing protein [Lachnospiraceae bacterium]
MITVYKKKNIPKGIELVKLNDIYFNKYTVELLDERAVFYISKIDASEYVSKYMIKSRFGGEVLNIDKLSTGCKTLLNIFYNPDIIFDIRECGENALDLIYALPEGNIYCDYPLISFDMTVVRVAEKKEYRIIDEYDELKEWWASEN